MKRASMAVCFLSIFCCLVPALFADDPNYKGDLNRDGAVDFIDFSIFADNWLKGVQDIPPPFGVIVAAKDAPSSTKAIADYVCDGNNDEEEIAAALSSNMGSNSYWQSSVQLSAGTFHIGHTIHLKSLFTLQGAGVRVTTLAITPGASCDMFDFNDIHQTVFACVRDMMFAGNTVDTSGWCFNFKTTQRDFYINNVFINGFKDGGIKLNGAWGVVINNSVIEFCTGPGLAVYAENNYTLTGGTLSGSLALGETVVQASTNASGRTYYAYANGATTLNVCWDSGSVWTASQLITGQTSGATYTPAAVTYNRGVGPKVYGCKIIANSSDQVYLGPLTYLTTITGSELSPRSGYYAIALAGSAENMIVANRFNGLVSGSKGFIGFIRANDAFGNPRTAYQTQISSNSFIVDLPNIPAIDCNYDTNAYSNALNVISNNVFIVYGSDYLAWNNPALGGTVNRNIFRNNQIVTDSENLTHKWSYEKLPNSNNVVYLYYASPGQVYETSQFTTTRTVKLPFAEVGRDIAFIVGNSNALQIDPQDTETLNLTVGGLQQAAGKYATCSGPGTYIRYKCIKPGRWDAVEVIGTWTVEP
jgi:hypothetical protein